MKTALVTGGNRGIGQQVCRTLAKDGWRVLLAARDPAKGEPAIARVRAQSNAGKNVRLEILDVESPQSIAACAARLEGRNEFLHALVNNAGVYAQAATPAGFAKTLLVNFFGPLRVTDALAPRLAAGANVVMVTSGLGSLANLPPARAKELSAPTLDRAALVALMEAAMDGKGGWPRDGYAVSKAALNALTRILAREWGDKRNIHVNAVCPGWVRTDMGGRDAPRSIEEGASGVTWAATLPEDGPTGGLFRDGHPIDP